jgi:hypothetical protein
MPYTTLLEAITVYSNASNKRQIVSAINRYLLPAFGLKLSKNRMKANELVQAQELMGTIKLTELSDTDLLEALERGFEYTKTEKESRRYPRSYIKLFIEFLRENKSLKNEMQETINNKEKSGNPPVRYLRNRKAAILDKSHIEKTTPKRKNKTEIKLSFNPSKYLDEFKKKYPEKEDGELLKIIQHHLERISKSLSDFENFIVFTLNDRKITAELASGEITKLLGWLHKKGEPLDGLTVEKIISVIDTRVNIYDFIKFEDFLITEGKLRHKAKNEADKTIKLIKDFFLEYEVLNSRTKQIYLGALITLVKYLYRDITDESEASNYEDISVITKLRVFINKMPKQAKKIDTLPLTWAEVLEVRERLRLEANETHIYSDRNRGNKVRTERSQRRSKSAISASLMRFLVLSMLTVIPPDRQRTFRELRMGKTLKHGLFTEAGFTPRTLLPNSNNAKYYIHLMPEDYKTGGKYGEFIGEIPNIEFKDGSEFYDYLNRWIYEGYREVMLRGENHDFLFTTIRKGVLLDSKGMCRLVSHIFKNKTKITVNPHKLRHIFCSYLDEIQVSDKERDAAAFWMHHSTEMAKNIYTIRDIQEKLRPTSSLMVKMNNSALLKS